MSHYDRLRTKPVRLRPLRKSNRYHRSIGQREIQDWQDAIWFACVLGRGSDRVGLIWTSFIFARATF
jgi:hypothetical protein